MKINYKKVFKSLLVVVVLVLSTTSSFAQKTWNGNTSANWGTGSNWTPNGVPASTDDVIIPNVGTARYATTSSTINSLTVNNGGVLEFQRNNPYELTVSGNVTVNTGGIFRIRNGNGGSSSSNLFVGGNFTNAATVDFVDDDVINLVLNGTNQTISGAGTYSFNNLTTSNNGIATLSSIATFNGRLTINTNSTFRLGAANLIPNATPVTLNGGTFSNGTTGVSETIGALTLSDNSTIALGTGNSTLTFAASNGAAWTADRILTITGWVGGYNGSAAGATNPKIFIGTTTAGLTAAQLNQIQFFDGTNYYLATLRANGELVPNATPRVQSFSPTTVCSGSSVTITGIGFTGATAVSVNGVNVASFVVNSYTSITAILSTTNTTGQVTVVGPNGTTTSTASLIVNPLPVISAVFATPVSVCLGSSTQLNATATNTIAAISQTNSTVTAIPDNNLTGVSTSITVPSTSATAAQVATVSLNITHTYNADLDIYLVAPNGSQIALSLDKGGSGDNYNATFQTGGAALPGGNTTITGTFAPEEAFSGLTGGATGNWGLRVVDDATFDVGSINSWSINFNAQTFPVTYSWSPATGLNNAAIANPVATPTSTTTYIVTATSNGCSVTSNVTVTVNPLPTASITGNNGPAVCSGSDITFSLTGTSGAVVTYNLNGGSTTTVTLTGGSATVTVSAATATQTLNLVSVTDGTCPATLSGSSTVVIESTTWDGTSWSDGLPTSTKAVNFTGNYTIGADFDACSISVSNNAVVSVTSGFNVSLNGAITVASGSSFTLNNNANLYQADASAVNTGNIIVKRQSNPLIRLDYTMWSSPVTGQGLYAFSPFTFANRFYVYDTTSNLYNNSSIGFNVTGTNAAGVNGTDTANVPFTTGKGYLIRLPYNHPTAPVIFNGSFTGVPNNGTKTITLANVSATQQFNAVGNPYPSPISIAQFATDNASNIEPTLYFWRKTNNAASPSYCTWNTTSSLFGDNGEAYTNTPNGVIQTGQGFLVEAKDGATSLEFNNGQRVANNANQFFRTTTVATPTTQPDAIWLNLTGTGAEYSQAVVSYFTNATLGADAYDSKYFNDGAVALNMVIGSTEYVIQGRPTFQATDIVPLNYKVTTAGTYTFAIDHVDGLFTGGAQAIYIKDNQDGSYHNLSTPYTFTSAAGTFANRFELVYQTALANNDNSFTANSINVIKQQNDVVVRTSGTTMKEVTIYDIRGRVLVAKTNINANETKINVGTTNQVLLVQVTTVDGVKATKKVVN